MLRLAGEFSLIFALICAACQFIIPMTGFFRGNPYLSASARPFTCAQFIFVVCAYTCLTIAFGMNDFSIAYVAANSHPTLPLMYRLTAVWGEHEGSILLWILILNIWTMVYLVCSQKKSAAQQLSLTLSILGLVSVCFLSFLLFTSNPFLLATQLLSGSDLNPLLQDPGFVIHPPMLYMGYVGFSVAFAITQAALLRGQLDVQWAQSARRFVIAAWCFLTFGITLGSWWAYRVLGWGGFWFWDPVENASLLPWIAGTALIHVLILSEKRGIAKGWAALLSILCFALSLLGTFLVRSGVLISVHTFANDPARGVFLLLLLAIVLTAALLVYVKRLPLINNTPNVKFELVSRETSLLINSGMLFIAMLTILLGTLYPLMLDALNLGTISVGPPYFNMVMAPLVFITMVFMACGPYCHWERQSHSLLLQQAGTKFVISFITALCLSIYFTHRLDITALITLTLSFWILFTTWSFIRTIPGMAIAHGGFAVLIVGIMLSSLLSQEKDVRMAPGATESIGPYQFLFIDTTGVQGPNYRGIQASFEVTKDDRHIVNLYPEKRIYTVRDMVMTKVDIDPSLFRDLYIALGEPLNDKDWTVRIYYKPFMRWIWAGGIMMLLGGLVSLSRKQLLRLPR